MQTISRLAGLALLSLYISCFSSETVKCGDNGPTCPVGWTCIAELSACINPLETLCGNGVVDEGEECDDGNFDNRDGCNWDCRAPRCGDGFVRDDLGEVCDDGNTGSGDGCSSDCKSREICGDGIINTVTGEACDSGSFCSDLTTACTREEDCEGIGDGTCGPRNINCCTAQCLNPFCGNGVTERDCAEIHTDRIMEVCDFGSQCANGQPCIVNGDCTGIGDGRCQPRDNPNCSQTCLFASPCGDGIVNRAIGEVCDGGRFCADLSDCVSDADCAGKTGDELCLPRNTVRCTADCRSEGVCGDGILNNVPPYDEVCDDGKHCANGLPCATNAECGDGECIPRGDDGCSADCKATGRCGDGERDEGEACDDGNRIDGDGCSADCRNRCGDGVLHASEECDDGEECSDGVCNGTTRACLPQCVRARCGDRLVQAGVEDCDSGSIDSEECNQDCTFAECGDGYRNVAAGEECDSRGLNTIDCNENCLFPRCGDSIVNRAVGERCDDGNRDNLDGCSADCTSTEECGDGVTNFAVGELCDNGKTCDSGGACESDDDCPTDELCLPRSGDNCSKDCRSTEICGDGYVNLDLEDPETCDDFNLDGGDGCDTSCHVERGWACEPRGASPTSTSRCSVVCGDGIVVAGFEACDDGDTTGGDGCSAVCQLEVGWACPSAGGVGGDCTPVCGDGLVRGGEPCDDGNTAGNDGCSSTCTVEAGWSCPPQLNGRCQPVCGDGLVRGVETCDDGDTTSLDGCSSACQLELGWTCDEPGADCDPICGDSLVRGGEACDDGNTAAGDGCSSTCTAEPGWECPASLNGRCRTICGDGLVRGTEGCDDSNLRAGDGCGATCQPEAGWTCPIAGGTGGACTADCGDGLVRGTEQCDDANRVAGDGCGATCQPESGWACPRNAANQPIGGSCREVCGDGQVVGAETCDDTNANGGDGCDSGCRTEDGWTCPPVGGLCTPICGDGRVVGVETCDEGTSTASGGCTNCARAPGWSCVAGQTCISICGDGIRVGSEECDNGANNANNNVCTTECMNATCTDDLHRTQGTDPETDVDCGGACRLETPPLRCANDLRCAINEDCESNFCSNGRCRVPLLGPDVWTVRVDLLDGDDKTSIPVGSLTQNDAGGAVPADAIFEIVQQPVCGTVSESSGLVTFVDQREGTCTDSDDCDSGEVCVAGECGCGWGQQFWYRVCSPTNAAECSDPTTVTVNINHPPVLDFPDICLPLTTSFATVNVSSTSIFLDEDANPWGLFPRGPTDPDDPNPVFVSGPGGHTAALTVNGASLTVTPDGGPQPGTYTVEVEACDNVTSLIPGPLEGHRGCSPATLWQVRWQASVDLREYTDQETFPVAATDTLTFPLSGTSPTASIVDGVAPADAIVGVAASASGPFIPTVTTSRGQCSYVDDGTAADRRVTFLGNTPGTDSCYVQVCETCGDINLCSIMRLPLVVAADPVAVADDVTALEGKDGDPAAGSYTRTSLTANDTSIDGTTFTLVNHETTVVADPAETDCEGQVTFNGTTITYTGKDPSSFSGPNDPCRTADTFTYRVTSPAVPDLFAYGTVNIEINQHPNAVDDTRSTAEDSTLVISDLLGNDTDPDPGTTLKISSLGAVSNGNGTVQLSANGLSVTYIPAPGDFNGQVTFTYTITDGFTGNEGTDTATVTVNVTPVTDIVADSVVTNEDTPIDFNPITGTNGASADNFENAAPALTHFIIDDVPVAATTTPVDVDIAGTVYGTVSADNNLVTFTPTADFNGAVPAFKYRVTSGGVTEEANINITVLAVADITDDTLSTDEDTAHPFNPVAGTSGATADSFEGASPVITHINGTSITAGGGSIAVTHGSVSLASGNILTFTPTADYNGPVPAFTYTVLSGGVSETANITFTVNAIDDIVADTVSGTEDTPAVFNPVTGTGTTTTPPNDSFEGSPQITHINGAPITAGGAPVVVTDGSVSLSNVNQNELTFTPRADFNGSVPAFTYTVLSGGVSETANITVTVQAATDTVTDDVVTNEDTAIEFNVFSDNGNGADTFADTGRTVTAVSQGANGAVTIVNGSAGILRYTPAPDYFNTSVTRDTFQYTVRTAVGTTTPSGLTENGNVNVQVDPVNDPPTLTAGTTARTFTEDVDAATDPLFTGSAASPFEDDQDLDRLVLTVTNAHNGASEELLLYGTTIGLHANTGGPVGAKNMSWTVTRDGNTATITLTWATGLTDEEMEGVIDAIVYENTSEDPTEAVRTVTITRIEDDGPDGAPNVNFFAPNLASTVTVVAVNDPPTLTVAAQTPTFTEDGAPADLYDTVVASTVEAGQTLTRLDLTVSNVSDGGAERLLIDGAIVPLTTTGSPITTVINSMSVSVDAGVSPVQITISKAGGISTGAMQTLIDNLAYTHTSQDPTAGARDVVITRLDDSGSNINPNVNTATFSFTATVTVVAVNDPPTLTATALNPSYNEAAAPAPVYSLAAVNTIENAQTIVAIDLTVSNVSNLADEKLTIDGTTFLIGSANSGTTTGGLSVGYAVTFSTGTATVLLTHGGLSTLDAQDLVNSIAYSNTNTNSTAGPRVVTLTRVQDSGASPNSTVLTVASTVTVIAVNNPPVIGALNGDELIFNFGGGFQRLDAGTNATVTDADSPNFASGSITVTITNNLNANGLTDTLDLTVTGGDSYTLTGSGGSNIKVGPTNAGVWSYSEGVLSILFNTSTVVTPTIAQQMLRNIRFNSTGQVLSPRTVSFVVNDGDGGTSSSAPALVTVSDQNDPPTLTADSDPTATFVEGGAGADIFDNVQISTIESNQNVARIDITVTNLADGMNEYLTIDGTDIELTDLNQGTTDGNDIDFTVTVDGTTATVMLTKAPGGILEATAEAGLDAMTYSNASDDPTPTPQRVVSIVRIDDTGPGTPPHDNSSVITESTTLTITPVNDPPTLTVTTKTPTFTEGGPAVDLFDGADASTIEAGQNFALLRLTISNVTDGSPAADEEFLVADGSDIPLVDGSGTTEDNEIDWTVDYNSGTDLATIEFTKTGGITDAVLENLINGLAYDNVSTAPTVANRVVTITRLEDTGANGGGDVNFVVLNLFSTVSLEDVNSPPTSTNDTLTINEDAVTILQTSDFGDYADDENTPLESVLITAVTGDGLLEFDTTDAGGWATVSPPQAISASHIAANRLRFTPDENESGDDYAVISFRVSDGTDLSTETYTLTIDVTPVNDEPTLTGSGTNPTHDEGDPAEDLFSGSPTPIVADAIEAGQNFDLLVLTVSNVTDGTAEKMTFNAVEFDLVTTASTATGAGWSRVVALDGGTATVTLTPSPAVDAATLEGLVDGLAYRNTSEDPTDANRVVTITTLSDDGPTGGLNDDTNEAVGLTSTVNVNPINDPPTLTGSGTNPTHDEGDPAEDLFSGSPTPIVADAIEAGQNFDLLVLTVSNVTDGTAEKMTFNTVEFDLVTTASTATGTGWSRVVALDGGTATVTLTPSPTVDAATLEGLIDGLAYRNTSEDPTDANRVVTITTLSDDGPTGGLNDDTNEAVGLTSTVNVNPINDPPTLTGSGTNPTHDEGDPAEDLFSGSPTPIVADAIEAGQNFDLLVLTVSNVTDGDAEKLTFNGVEFDLVTTASTATGSGWSRVVDLDAGTATVTLTPSPVVNAATLEGLVDGLAYRNTSENPTDANRVVTITTLSDDGPTGGSNDDTNEAVGLASTVNVNPINDAPEITTTSFIVPENTITVGTVLATDPDSMNLTFTKTGGADESFFEITEDGVLTLTAPLDFEVFDDSNDDGVYEVQIMVEDDNDPTAGVDTAMIFVTVIDACPTGATLVISQVYAGGGNSGATYTHDFVELHNRSNSEVDVTGWSVQYAPAASSSWSATALTNVIIPSGGYYLVQLASGGAVGDALPTPDATGATAMAVGGGKVALVPNTTTITDSCPASTAVVDLVGWGGATCFEGAAAADEATTNTDSVMRDGSGETDTNDNFNDFSVQPVSPRNSTDDVFGGTCEEPPG